MFPYCTFIIIVLVELHISYLKRKDGAVLLRREGGKDALKSAYFEERISLFRKGKKKFIYFHFDENKK